MSLPQADDGHGHFSVLATTLQNFSTRPGIIIISAHSSSLLSIVSAYHRPYLIFYISSHLKISPNNDSCLVDASVAHHYSTTHSYHLTKFLWLPVPSNVLQADFQRSDSWCYFNDYITLHCQVSLYFIASFQSPRFLL